MAQLPSDSLGGKKKKKKLTRHVRISKTIVMVSKDKTRRFRFNKDHIPRTRGVRLNLTIPVAPLPPQPKGTRFSLVAFTTADVARVGEAESGDG